MKSGKRGIIWLSSLFGAVCSYAAGINYTGASGGDWATGSNWSGGAYPGTGDYAKLDKTANLSAPVPNNIIAIRIGTVNTGVLNINPGATLTATANSGSDSHIGAGSGNSGTVNQSGGSATINYLEIGRGGTGLYALASGGLTIARGKSGNSLYLGTDDTKTINNGIGTLEISGGSFLTRTGVHLGSANGSGKGTFAVLGSAATTIGVGSSGSIDGSWTQNAGSTLRVGIDPLGLTKIFVDAVEGTSQSATFESGSLLDVGYYNGGSGGGTWTVLELENGSITDNGLAFAQGVDTGIWSFNVDNSGSNGLLTVTATGTPVVVTNATVGSIAQLRQYAKQDNMTVTMLPGTYWMEGEADPVFLDFSGSNSSFDLTGVHIKVDTRELAGYGSATSINVVGITGDHVSIDGLTLSMEKLAYNGTDSYGYPKEYCADKSSQVMKVTGSYPAIRNCIFTSGGSYPYGFGDAFGKGARPNNNGVTDSAWIAHSKQSGILFTGGCSNGVMENVVLNMRSFGHGIFFQQGAHDLLFNNCQVLGDTMADSDDIIAHPEYQAWGHATYKEPIPADIRISKHEGGFRSYGNSDYASNGFNPYIENITITNCRVERMRTGVAAGANAGYLRVYDTEIQECEYGFGSSAYGTTLYKNCKGDALNGPLVYFQYGVDFPATYEVELTGSVPGHGVWPIALISGTGNQITLTSSAAPGVYSQAAYVNTSQKWREWRHRPSGDIDELATGNYADYTTGNFITNLTEQILVFGPNATANTGCVSSGGVINKGAGNQYTGETLVPAPILVQDTWSYPPNPTNVPWAQTNSVGELILPTPPYTVFGGTQQVVNADSLGGSPVGDGGTTVSNGTVEVAPNLKLQGEDLLLYGTGTAGQGAVYSDGTPNNQTRLSSSSGTITLAGDTAIGVGMAGNELLMGPMTGTGSLTKIGPGTLTLEGGGNSFDGSVIISNGWIKARANKVKNDLVIATGAGLKQHGNPGINQAAGNSTVLDGTIDINGRSVSDTGAYSIYIGSLTGGASGLITATSTAATQTANVNSGSFDGAVNGRVALVKNGVGTTLALNGTCTHTEGTFVNAGRLGGTGTINGNVTVAGGAGIAPGNSVGTLTTGPQTWNDNAEMDVGIGVASNDLLAINGSLTLNGTAFLINISAPDVGFDESSMHSWKIVDAGSVSGFSAGKFSVDATAFAANNPLLGGTFSVSESGGNLYLDFAPMPYTALEQWRFQKFGTYSNAGDAADGADPEGDGRNNLVEYGAGSDPNVFDSNSVVTTGTTLDGSKLTVTFDRISDPALVYGVEANTNLVTGSWSPIWSSTGPSNTAGSVTVEDTGMISNYWNRFLRVKLMY